MNPPAPISSIIGAESIDSDVQSINSDAQSINSDAHSIGSDAQSTCNLGTDKTSEPRFIPENAEGVKAFAHGDGDFELCVNGILFQTHKYLLKRFSGLKRMIEQKAVEHRDKPLTLEREHGLEDFRNTLKVLYASPIEGPMEFDAGTLVSALRIATAYDYPALRAFAVNNLEKAHLSAIDRIRIAREFSFASWEAPAYVELCEREEPITEQEANALGMSAFVQVSRIREKEQRRRGEKRGAQYNKEVGGANGEREDREYGSGKPTATPVAQVTAPGECKVEKNTSNAAAIEGVKLGVTSEDMVQADGAEVDDAVKKSAKALEQLQVRQVAQASHIIKLESAVQEIKSGWEPPRFIADAGKFNSNRLPELTVQAEVHEWLSLGACNEQSR
ncbi:hypothetical protein FRC06_008704 [Ceratobasidium sp. 370]|nr:hypothetical protein FRC06_008704 [Ceratobasidium sp. 370]